MKQIKLDPGLRRGDPKEVAKSLTTNVRILQQPSTVCHTGGGRYPGFHLILTVIILATTSLCSTALEKELNKTSMLEIKNRNNSMTLSGQIKDELFVYNRVNTLRSDYYDSN